MNKPIKTDLFSFVTLRTPQLISEDRKSLGFIFHPDPSQSTFLNKITDEENVEQSRNQLAAETNNFQPLQSYTEVKAVDEQLYKFSAWLMDNRNTVTKAAADEKANGVTTLSSADELLLWDNLYYQAITKTSDYVRQACIQMIIANNFIKELNNPALPSNAVNCITEPCDPLPPEGEAQLNLYVQRLANAKVVMHKAFTNPKAVAQGTDMSNKDFTSLENAQKSANIDVQVAALETAIKELKTLELQYNKDRQEARKQASDAYKAAAKQQFQDSQSTSSSSSLSGTETSEPEPVLNEDLSAFEFTYDSMLSDNYLTAKVSPETQAIVNAFSLALYEEPAVAYDVLADEIANYQQEQFNLVNQSKKVIVANGAIVSDKKAADKYCYVISGFTVVGNDPSQRSLSLTMNLGEQVQVTAATYELTVNTNAPVNGTAITQINNPNNPALAIIRLFPQSLVDLTVGDQYTLTGTFTLSNGDEVAFSTSGSVIKGFVIGRGCATMATDEDPTGDQDNEVNLFGINRIGIADFRKVEQELSCYVAGEVSHIENIMAREFKDKATRNLISSESTVETSTEVEVENLSETTTSERNELQTEVSNVLNQDQSQNYGASVGVSSEIGNSNLNVNSFANFANSSSSSQSNSVAQNYAQEVTERTLERIVKKTAEKRTSRILKEYEENNRHGFDNREGADHVTGVYRWVDKIYNNKLINYGKRLMYEFMIPEPAKFFKQAIVKKEENLDYVFSLEAPVAPRDLPTPLASAKSLTRANYQNYAALYDAEVQAPLDTEIVAGTSLTTGAGNVANQEIAVDTYSVSGSIAIPRGYEAYKASGIFNAVSNGGTTSGRLLSLTIGNKTSTHTTPFYTEDVVIDNATIKPFRDEVPVSATLGNHASGDISATVTCRLTTEAFEQWQNDTYAIIIEAYNQKLLAYKEAKATAGIDANTEEQRIAFNPLYNRAIEKREIKRVCTEMLAKPFGRNVGENHLVTPTGAVAPKVKQNNAFESYAAQVKFFEQAFDWEIMAYLFYPYYWANEQDWIDLFQSQDASDPIFQGFLQSGMARIVVPVRPGFEDAVSYYTETGDIWNGGDLVIDHDDDLYISIAEEMQTVAGVVEKEWETRVPTALTIIQAKSAALDAEGLPCYKEGETGIGMGESELDGSSQGVGSFVVS